MESQGLSDKEKADLLLTLCTNCFNRRHELEGFEWKLNFSLWTGTAIATWAVHTKGQHLGPWSLLLLLVLPFHFYWVRFFNLKEQDAVSFAMRYLEPLEKFLGSVPDLPPRTKLPPWYLVETSPTLLLILAAMAFVW